MTKLRKCTIAMVTVIALAATAIVAINAFDDKLDPKAATAGEPRAPRVPDAQNGYFPLLAMGADDGADGAAFAKAWLAEARAAASENRIERRSVVKRAKRPDLCDAMRVSCLAAVAGKVAETEAALTAWQEDLVRYEKLLANTAYEEVLDYPMRHDSGLPGYVNVGMAQRAYLVRAALAVQAGRLEEALAYLEKDVAFQRVMLEGSRTLIARMIAASNYSRDLAFISDLLQTSTADLKPHAPRVTALLKPLPEAALVLEAVFDAEFGGIKRTLKEMVLPDGATVDGVLGWLGRHTLYKPNQTINMVYRDYQTAVNFSKLGAAQQLAESKQPVASNDMSWWNYIENPIGNILTRISMPSFHGYALRLRDVDAHNRLVALAAEIVAQDVVTENVADFVAKSDARFFDPYTGKPMMWDAIGKRLFFKRGQTDNNRGGFNVENGTVFVTL